MNSRNLAIIIVFTSFFSLSGFAQSNRTEPKTEGKRNNRPAEPTPTPLVTPVKQLIGQDTPTDDDGEVIRVSTQLVSIPVRVMDRKGRFLGGLGKENFKVFENGKEQEIALFSNENQAFTVALMLDMSYSTKFKIGEIQSAAMAFIDQLRPQDRVLVVSFDGEIHVHCGPTSDRKEIFAAIKSTRISTGTSLYDAVDLVMNDQLATIEGRKAIILFSDGVDTTSRRQSDFTNLNDAMELDSLIYTIKYDTFADVQAMKSGPVMTQPKISIPTQNGSPIPNLPSIGTPSSQGTTVEEYQRAAEYLDKLADRTGGRRYDATTLGNLSAAYSKIASELREFYSVGFYPSEEMRSGKALSIKVKVDQENTVVRSRDTYSVKKTKKVSVN